MIEANAPLLSEILRPQTLADLNLPEPLLQSLCRLVKSGTMMNLLFYGQPGIGKTSAARILIKEMDADVYELNGSFNNGDKTMVRGIEEFSYAVSLTGRPKICFIDESDHLTKSAQDSLRYLIENVSGNTRFLLTANDIGRLTPAMRSRCTPICFDVRRSDSSVVVERMVSRYEERLAALGYSYDPQRLREIVGVYFPDLRNIANQFQLEFG